MEFLAPLALGALGAAAANGMSVKTGGQTFMGGAANIVSKQGAPLDAQGMVLNQAAPGTGTVPAQGFDPIMAHYVSNADPNRIDNIQPLRTVWKDPKYALTPQSGQEFQYDQQNRGSSQLENQWYYSNLSKDSETPLSMGQLPEYKRSTGVMLRDPDAPDILKPQKKELNDEDVWVAQPDQDRKRYDPITQEQARRARNESKYAGGGGALDGFYMNDKPGSLGGASKGWSTGLEPTRQWTGYHPKQRFFRTHDNQRQRTPHGLRAGLKTTDEGDVRSKLDGQYTNEKKQQISNYHQLAVADGGRQQSHLPDGMRKVQLRYTARDSAPGFGGDGLRGRNSGGAVKNEWQQPF